MMTIRSILLLGLIYLPVFSGCGQEKPGIQTMQITQEQTELVRDFVKMRALGMAGKVDQFVAMRDSITFQIVSEYLINHNKPLDSARVSLWGTTWPEVAGLPIVQDSILDNWRRLVFKRPNVFGSDGVEKAVYPVILFGLNGDEWKVSNATMIGVNTYNPDSTLRTIDQFTYHSMFRLPPDFRDLLPRDSTRQAPQPKLLPEEDRRRFDSLRDAGGR